MKSGGTNPKTSVFYALGTSKMVISAETVDARLTYIWLKDTTIGCVTAVEV